MRDDCGLDCGKCLRCEELLDRLMFAQIEEDRRIDEEAGMLNAAEMWDRDWQAIGDRRGEAV